MEKSCEVKDTTLLEEISCFSRISQELLKRQRGVFVGLNPSVKQNESVDNIGDRGDGAVVITPK